MILFLASSRFESWHGPLLAGSLALFCVGLLAFLRWKRRVGGGYRGNFFYRFLYTGAGFELLCRCWGLVGNRGAFVISRALALVYGISQPKIRRIVRKNLALLAPEDASNAAAMRVFFSAAENFAEYGALSRRDPAHVMTMIGQCVGLDFLQRAKDNGRGCLLVTGHLGFFELGGLILARMGFPVVALTLPEPTVALTQWRADFRMRWGVRTLVLEDSFSVVEIARELQRGAFVALLADRPYDQNCAVVDLPHGQINFASGPVLIATMAGCPLIPVVIARQSNGKYHMEATDYIEPQRLPEGRSATLTHYTRQIAASLMPLMVRYREQWHQFSDLTLPPEDATS